MQPGSGQTNTLANAVGIPGEVNRRSSGQKPGSRAAPMTTYQVGQVIQVTTVDVAHGGWCVARPDEGPVVFVRHALPGETVIARVIDVTSRLARAEAVEILTPSPDRVEAPCRYARPGGCGGCDWQHVACPPSGRSRPRWSVSSSSGWRGSTGRSRSSRCRETTSPARAWAGGRACSSRCGQMGWPAFGAPLTRGGRHRRVPDRPSRHHRSRPHGPALAARPRWRPWWRPDRANEP